MDIRQLQQLLKAESPDLVVDGISGIRTYDAYDRASNALKAKIAAMFPDADVSAKVDKRWISEIELNTLIAKISAEENVPASYLGLIAKIEPRHKMIGDVMYFDTLSSTGTFFGLGQMGRPAWQDAVNFKRSLPPFEKGWRDAETCLRATAIYYKVNLGYIKRKYGHNGPISDQLGYAMHNQGHTVYQVLAKNKPLKFPGQSKLALKTIELARAEFNNAPAQVA